MRKTKPERWEALAVPAFAELWNNEVDEVWNLPKPRRLTRAKPPK